MKNKTAKEWLEIARANGENWVDQALSNIDAQPNYEDRQQNYPSVKSMISLEFDWDASNEGFDYWEDIHGRLKKK